MEVSECDEGVSRMMVEAGVAQGDPTSGSLFVLVVDGLLRALLRTEGVSIARAFADDIAVVASTPQALTAILTLFSTSARPAASH